jgi:hypothetical protein
MIGDDVQNKMNRVNICREILIKIIHKIFKTIKTKKLLENLKQVQVLVVL